MDFFEFIFLFLVAFVLPLSIVKMSLEYKTAKVKARAGGDGTGVTAGELRRLLREAVEDANAPLLARIDDLERYRVAIPLTGDIDGDAFGEEMVEDEAAAQQDRTLGRRVSE